MKCKISALFLVTFHRTPLTMDSSLLMNGSVKSDIFALLLLQRRCTSNRSAWNRCRCSRDGLCANLHSLGRSTYKATTICLRVMSIPVGFSLLETSCMILLRVLLLFMLC